MAGKTPFRRPHRRIRRRRRRSAPDFYRKCGFATGFASADAGSAGPIPNFRFGG